MKLILPSTFGATFRIVSSASLHEPRGRLGVAFAAHKGHPAQGDGDEAEEARQADVGSIRGFRDEAKVLEARR